MALLRKTLAKVAEDCSCDDGVDGDNQEDDQNDDSISLLTFLVRRNQAEEEENSEEESDIVRMVGNDPEGNDVEELDPNFDNEDGDNGMGDTAHRFNFDDKANLDDDEGGSDVRFDRNDADGGTGDKEMPFQDDDDDDEEGGKRLSMLKSLLSQDK